MKNREPDITSIFSLALSDSHVPDIDIISELLSVAQTPPHIILHQQVVAKVAGIIASLYPQNSVDLELLNAVALLHDIMKMSPNHAERGAEFLNSNGFYELAKIIRTHTDLPKRAPVEAKILYLADKHVFGTHIESLEERNIRLILRAGGKKEELRVIKRRIGNALKIEQEIEGFTGLNSLWKYLRESFIELEKLRCF